MLIGRIAANQQDRRRVDDVAHARGRVLFSCNRVGERRKWRRPMMINVVGLQYGARKFLQKIIFFVGRAVRADYSNLIFAGVNRLAETSGDEIQRLFPRAGFEPPVLADERLSQPIFVICKIERVAALNTQKIAVDSALVAIVAAHNLHAGISAAHAQRSLAAIAAVRACRGHVVHLPRTRLIAIRARRQRAHRAYVNAHAALFAFEVIIAVGRNGRSRAAVLYAQRPHVHAFAADAHAAIAQNAAWTVEIDYRQPLLLVAVLLELHVLRFRGAVAERHVLQFALAARVTYRAIQRMVAQQDLHHALARLLYFVAVGTNHHSIGDGNGARGLQLGHLLNAHQAHPARALQRKVRVIAERGNFDARALAGFDQQGARRRGDLLADRSLQERGHRS